MTRRRAGWAAGALALLALALLVDLLRPLPAAWFAPHQTRRVVDRDGGVLVERPLPDRGHELWVELDQVAPVAVDALLASEDHRFYAHLGVDPRAVARASWASLRAGRAVQGGSTLTQQLARLLAGRPPGLPGKVVEAWRALKLEAHLDKREILTWYLDRAYFGRGSYGIEAAARRVFDESAASLSPAEAALLVGLLPAPERLHPEVSRKRAREARDRVLERMVTLGSLSAEAAARARAEPIELRRRATEQLAPHLVARVLDEAPGDAVIRTTIDPALQRRVEDLVRRQLADLASYQVDHAAVLVVDVASSEVLAYVGSGGFDRDAGQVDAVRALRSPGSALKPFVYALALEDGVRPGDLVLDLPARYATTHGSWAPENYSRDHRGPLRVREALATSANLPAVGMLQRVGVATLQDRLLAMGFSLPEAATHYGLGLALGDAEVRLEDLVGGYAALARDGRWLPLRLTRDAPRPRPVAAFPPDVARVIADVLADPVARAPAFGRYGPLERPYPAAVKTGTSTGYRDNWTVGFTDRYVVGVWVGNFDNRPMGDVSGVTGAGPLWAAVMDAVTGGEAGPLRAPAGWVRHRTCALSGGAAGPSCPHTVDDWAPASEPERPPCAWHRPGTCRVDWPPELVGWARENGRLGGEGCAVTGDVAIAYPPGGTVLYVDPRLPADAQRVPLRADAPASATVQWQVDGEAVGDSAPGVAALWEPRRVGSHRIAVLLDGVVRDEVTVEILGAPR
ncbi:MAG: penicillin-binding protein 1C [Myxococcota bacterium]